MGGKRNGANLTCEHCGESFYVPKCLLDTRRFCSRECYEQHISGAENPNWKGGRVKRECEICGQTFYVKRKTVRNGFGRFCSRACFGEWRSQDLVGESGCNWQGGPIEVECVICGKAFRVNRHRHESTNVMYCSRECLRLGRTGELSPAWQGGISFEPYPPEFNTSLKNRIRRRDSHTCQLCGERGRNVHHIDYDKSNCKPDNLITLCDSCHSRTNWNRDEWESLLVEAVSDG